MAHIIRLRGPWDYQPLGSQVRITRRFHRPTGLDPETRVWLVIDEVQESGRIVLNGQPVGQFRKDAGPARFDITGFLQPRNVLEVNIEASAESSSPRVPFGQVRLEIEGESGVS